MARPKSKVGQLAALFEDLLIPDLKLIGQEARKRAPQLKEACEEAIVAAGTVDVAALDRASTPPQDFLKAAERFWQPLLLALDSKNNRMVALALGAVQKLVSHALILPSHVGGVVSALTKLRDTDETVQLKLLQCLMSLFSREYELSSMQMPSVLTMAFGLHTSKQCGNTVQSTAAATITQITTAQFDKLACTEGENFATAKTAYWLLKDLCTLLAGDEAQHIKLSGEVPRVFIFDLLHTVVRDHGDTMATCVTNPRTGEKELVSLVQEDMSLVLAQSIKSCTDLQTVVRMHRLVGAMLQKFPEELVKQQELFVGLLCGALDQPESPGWQKVSILSCFRDLADDFVYLRRAFSRFDSVPKHSKLFEALVGSVCGLIKRTPAALFPAAALGGERVTPQKLFSAKSDDELALRPAEPLLWAVEVVGAVCKSLSKLVDMESRPLTASELENNVPQGRGGEPLARLMIGSVKDSVQTALTALLERSTDNSTVEETLRCFKLFTHACGKAGLPNARDSLVRAMNASALPAKGPLTSKNTQVVRILFDVANGLGGALDSSWGLLLRTLQQLSQLLDSGDSAGPSPVGGHELDLLRDLLRDMFDGTKYYDDEALLSIVRALCALSLEAGADSEKWADRPGSPSSRAAGAAFALQRLSDVAVANTARLGCFWGDVSAHLSWMAKESREPATRKAVVETASHVVLAYLRHCRDAAAAAVGAAAAGAAAAEPTPHGGAALLALQPKVLEVLREMRLSKHPDVRSGCLNVVLTLVERNGQELAPPSWRLILNILESSTDSAAEVTIGFRSVELVCTDFMSGLDHDCLQALIICVGRFAQQQAQRDRTNTNLTAIQQGLLSIADYCASHPEHTIPTHWNSLFVQLRDVVADGRPEVRHSALKTLFNALVTHGASLPPACWNTLFWDVLLRVLDSVHAAALAAEQTGCDQSQMADVAKGFIVHYSRNTPAKQWYETRCTVLDGVVRVIKVFYALTSKHVSRFRDVLTRVATHLANACMHTTDEVATVGLKSLADLLDIAAAEDDGADGAPGSGHGEVLMSMVWNTWERLADTAAKDSSKALAATAVLTTLVETVADLHQKAAQSPRIRRHQSRYASRLLPLLKKLMNSSAALNGLTFPTKLQKAALRCLEARPLPDDSEALQTQLIQTLCSFLPAPEHIHHCLEDPEQQPRLLEPGKVALAEPVLASIADAFCSPSLPQGTKAHVVSPVLKQVEAALLTRHFTNKKYFMWRAGLAVVERVYEAAAAGGPASAIAWPLLVSSAQTYLQLDQRKAAAGSSRGGVHDAAAQSSPGDECDVAVLGALHKVLMPLAVVQKESDVIDRLMELIALCSKAYSEPALSEEALNLLFKMCDAPHGGADENVTLFIGRSAMPHVVARCRQILGEYIDDERSHGKCPLPRHRREEVVCVLQRLAESEFNPELFADLPTDSPQLRETCPAAFKQKGLAVRLLPVLVQYVGVADDAIRAALEGVMLVVCGELGLSGLDAVPPMSPGI